MKSALLNNRITRSAWSWLMLGMVLTLLVYLPSVSGGWLFDDFPNIVDNTGIHIKDLSLPSLTSAALSSPSSDLKRPLASLSFALNDYLAHGDPAPMKATNIVIHLLNGWAMFMLVRALLQALMQREIRADAFLAAGIATAWMLMPINLTAVAYVVQRMESMANLFVLLGLWAYIAGRQRMQKGQHGAWLAYAGVLGCTAVGALAKETAILLPLYAAVVEAFVFHARRRTDAPQRDSGIFVFFSVALVLPMLVGLAWLVPRMLDPKAWATRDFTLATRLLSEARIVVDYIGWTVAPTPGALSFYHDDFLISSGLFSPWTTAASIVCLAALAALAWCLRKRMPMTGLGIALYLACHTLTATIIPLELIYEHRNYFASMGIAVALAGILVHLPPARERWRPVILIAFAALTLLSAALTASTAAAWGDMLQLAKMYASRAPYSPRAQYELGRTYIIYSRYAPDSPYTRAAYPPLERAAALPGSSILPEQALIFMNARMHRPIKDAWWQSILQKLQRSHATIQDESSLEALSNCLANDDCQFDATPLHNAFLAAMSQSPSARLTAMYADFAWRTLGDRELAFRLEREAVAKLPNEPAYHANLARYAAVLRRPVELTQQIDELRRLNIGGRLQKDIDQLQQSLDAMAPKPEPSP